MKSHAAWSRLRHNLPDSTRRIFYQITAPDPSIKYPEERRQIRLLLTLYLIYIVFGFGAAVAVIIRTIMGIETVNTLAVEVGTILLGNAGVLGLIWLTKKTVHFKTSTLIMIGTIAVACLLTAVKLDAPVALVFLNLGTLMAALFLSPRLAVLIILINAVSPPLLAAYVFNWSVKPLIGETTFLIFNSLVNLVIVAIRQSDLNKIERQSQALIEAERQQIALAAERERANALSHFVGDVSHDFRTPLAIINSGLYVLKRTSDPQQQERIQTIEQQTDRLLRLLEDMVAVVRLDSAAPLTFEAVSLNTLIEETTAKLAAQFQSRKLTLCLDLDAQLLPIQVDYDLLTMVLRKLLDNAIRFNREGGSVTVTTRQADQVVLRIADTGIGIDAAHMAHIFDLLYRADQARSVSTGGAGLGLSIVRKIVEAHGGTITVESIPDQGTTFTITLPVTPFVAPAPPAR